MEDANAGDELGGAVEDVSVVAILDFSMRICWLVPM